MIKLARLVDHGGKMNKGWYIEYQAINVKTGSWKRFRISKGFSELESREKRYHYADIQIERINRQLLDPGYDPFSNQIYIVSHSHTQPKGYPIPKKLTGIDLKSSLKLYFKEKQKVLRPKSFSTYVSKNRLFLKFASQYHLLDLPPKFITVEHARKINEWLVSQQNVSNRTHNNYIQTMYSIWHYFSQIYPNPLIDNNIWKYISKKSYSSISQKPFSPEQSKLIQEFLKTHDPWLLFFCEFQYYTLIRLGS